MFRFCDTQKTLAVFRKVVSIYPHGKVRLAEELGVTVHCLNRWSYYAPVSGHRIIDVCKLVDFAVLPHDLDPVLYPYPSDGVPPEVRRRLWGEPGRGIQRLQEAS